MPVRLVGRLETTNIKGEMMELREMWTIVRDMWRWLEQNPRKELKELNDA